MIELQDNQKEFLAIRPKYVLRVHDRPSTAPPASRSRAACHITCSDGTRIGLMEIYKTVLAKLESSGDVEFMEFKTPLHETWAINPEFIIRIERNAQAYVAGGDKLPKAYLVCSDGAKIGVTDEYKDIVNVMKRIAQEKVGVEGKHDGM